MAAFTRQALQHTLLTLLRSTPLNKITVKLLTDTCGVSRNTFYYHYADIADLLRDTLHSELQKISGERAQSDPAWRARRLLTYLSDNQIIFDRIYRSTYRPQLEADLLGAARDVALAGILSLSDGKLSADHQEAIATFFASGLLSLCMQWLRDSETTSVDTLLERLALFDGLMEIAVSRAKN